MMYTFLLACAIVFCVIILALAAFEVIADRWADYAAGAREQLTMADVKALPETTAFDPPADVVRARLRPVDPASLEWARIRRAVVPEQRDGRGH